MDDKARLLAQTLLSKGMAPTVDGVDIPTLNKYLNLIHYDVVEFPHRRILVLRDRHTTTAVEYPWKEKTVDDARRIFEAVATQRHVDEVSSTVDMLIQRNYLRREGGLRFTERTLVQFSEYIEGLNGRFRRCKLCGFLGDEGELHKACGMMMGNK